MKKFLLLLAMLLPTVHAWAEDRPLETYTEDKQGCHRQQVPEVGPVTTFSWEGKCKADYPDGHGTLSKFRDKTLLQTEMVTFNNKLREGASKTVFFDGGVMLWDEALYEHGKLNGKMVAHLANGDVLELQFTDGSDSGHARLTSRNGDLFEGESLGGGRLKGKWTYAEGGSYVGEQYGGAKNGQGVFTRKDGSRQEGEFILDEFVDIKDETAAKLMPARFGLQFGMTRKQVEALVGKMKESRTSQFRNSYDVEKFPDEKFAAPNLKVGLRNVYFDDNGRLWRVWAQILLSEDSYFGGAEVMQAYGSVRRFLALNDNLSKTAEPYPYYGDGIDSCRDVEDWEKENPKSFEMARETAPHMTRSQRVIFDIGCGAMAPWERVYTSRDGKESYYVGIRYGNLYATPVVYTAATADEEAMRKKMAKHPPAPAPASSPVQAANSVSGQIAAGGGVSVPE